jgi:serine/threonine protein kinase/tetratricopeptide (TPR) repeat protein
VTAERWQQIERVYLAALACDESGRPAMLEHACVGDAELRREVETLLAQEPRVDQFLESRRGLGDAASERSGADPGDDADLVAPPVDAEGLFAGRYRIVRLLGRGGMGVVYQAEDVRLKRFVALKFLAAIVSAHTQARSRFLREAQSAAAIDDPHVCTVYEAGEDQGRAYIAMAFIDGPTLRDRIAQGPLAIDEAVAIARGVAAGLAAAHARGVVHRDIKPGNVMLAGPRIAKVTDFGLARMEGGDQSTRTAGLAGTPAYMSPEQAQGLMTDHRTDIWSFGCVLYEMLTGRSPFSTPSGQVDVFAIVHGPPPATTAFRPDVPASLAAIVERCLQPDLRRRYQNASTLLADLEVVSEGGPTPVVRVSREDVPSIAVLPFADMSPDRTQEYFAEGMAEEIIHALARIEGVRVVARTSSFAVKGKGLDVREIGRVLNVGTVLEGSVRSSGSRLRITAQLITVDDGFHLWSERYDREAGDVFAIQDGITAAIVNRLAVALHLSERAALRERAPVDPEAYALYLKGRYFHNRIGADTVELALRFYGEAIAKDPAFARAHAGIAAVWGDLAAFNLAPPAVAWPKAREAAERALALDRDVPDALLAVAGMALWYEWDWTAAEAGNARALALNPGDALARGRHAWFLLNRRRFDECGAAIRQALASDPLSPLLYGFAVGLHAACGRGDEALADFRRAVELAPNFGLPYFHAAVAYTSLGRLDEAADVVEAGMRQGLTIFWADCILGIVRAKQGRRDEAAAILARMTEQHQRLDVSCASIAWVAASLGDFDTAFTWLDRGYEDRDGLMAWVHVYTDIFVPALARDPRFHALLERMRLTDVAR